VINLKNRQALDSPSPQRPLPADEVIRKHSQVTKTGRHTLQKEAYQESAKMAAPD